MHYFPPRRSVPQKSALRTPSGADEFFSLRQRRGEASCKRLGSSAAGLTSKKAARRLNSYGRNLITREQKPTIVQEIWNRTKNPLNALLLTLALVSWFLGDVRASVVLALMVGLAIVTAFIQEHRSNDAAAQVRAMGRTTTSARRPAQPANV